MFCGNCGKQVENGNSTCPYCGDKIVTTPNISKDTAKGICKKFFVSSNEQYITSLGDGYLKNFLTTGSIGRCVAVLSNKRIYLRGNIIDYNNSKLERINVEKIVNVEDVTGTGFIYASNQIWKLVLAALTAPLIIPPVVFIILYMLGRKTIFFIEYAGGYIKFDASYYNLSDVHNFQKQIRLVQDDIKNIS